MLSTDITLTKWLMPNKINCFNVFINIINNKKQLLVKNYTKITHMQEITRLEFCLQNKEDQTLYIACSLIFHFNIIRISIFGIPNALNGEEKWKCWAQITSKSLQVGWVVNVYVKYLNNCVIFSCKLFVSKGNLIHFGIFSYILYRILLLKEINLVWKWPRPSNSLK